MSSLDTSLLNSVQQIISDNQRIVVIQPENPDGDSIASAIALEHILADQGKKVEMFCAIDTPKYLRYIKGWDRISTEWSGKYDMAIIVDTAAEALLELTLQIPGVRHFLDSHPVLVFDHHQESDEKAGDLSFRHTMVSQPTAAATGELIYEASSALEWPVNSEAAEALFISIQSDTLGLTTESVSANTYRVAADLVALGAQPATIEAARRELMKKPADILTYKGQLIQRIEYFNNDSLALVHIPWDEIAEYSDRYNPSVLVLDEMRLVEGVAVAIAIKTYPDGKLTGKIRANIPVAADIAGYFGGGGHGYSAGFKIYEDYNNALQSLVEATAKIMDDYDTAL